MSSERMRVALVYRSPSKRFRSTVCVADLEAGGVRLSTPRRLTFDEYINWPTAWGHEGRSVLFTSDRGRRLDIFR